jgi:polysaccharide export outer membrane protein
MKALRIVAAIALTAAVWITPVAAQQAAQQPPPRTSGPYRIGVGDVLDIVVWRNRELSTSVTVRPDGWISYPIVGELRAEGITPDELRQRLEKGMAESVNAPSITVLVSRIGGFKVSVLGKVRQPGRYDAQDTTTVLDVLALAGGPNEYASPEDMYVLRRSRPDATEYIRLNVRYSSGLQPGKDNPNVTVRAGDIIVVP